MTTKTDEKMKLKLTWDEQNPKHYLYESSEDIEWIKRKLQNSETVGC